MSSRSTIVSACHPLVVPFAAVLAILAAVSEARAAWTFANVTASAGVNVGHDIDTFSSQVREVCTGAACADYDGDGWLDLYFLGGNVGHNYLFRNNGNGTFTDVAAAAGVDLPNTLNNGCSWADWDGDGDPDLFVGGLEGAGATFFRNEGDGTFTDVTALTGTTLTMDTFSGTFGDLDGDEDLDLLAGHWGAPKGTGHIWLNDATGVFTDSDIPWGYASFPPPAADNTFVYNLADLDSDGDQDFVVASDKKSSHVYRNDGTTMTNITNPNVIVDDNGMGSTVGDYDNDGDLDWFVTSIYSFPFTVGNRLYENNGTGVFTDATTTAGVADGRWGWGATFQDFNNDGHLDIYHVNGWRTGYQSSPSRMFVSNGNKTFTESAAALGVAHPGEGRGCVAFDYDRDGDLDIFIANNDQLAALFRNDGLTNNWLEVKLVGPPPNTAQIGARVKVRIGSTTQMREVRCGNNFLSQDQVDSHFGLGTALAADEVRVEWNDGQVTTLAAVAANQFLTVQHPSLGVTGVVSEAAAGGIELLGAAPNPFGHGTMIRFGLDRPSRAAVRVIDAAGRVVRTLADAERPAGRHAVSWDGRDDSGREVAGGVYWYEIRTADHAASGRITRVR